MSIRKNKNAYQVRVRGFRSVTVPTRKAAEKVELDLKLRRSLGELYEEAETTLGEEIDGFLAWKRAAGALSNAGYRHLEWSAKVWGPFRDTPISRLRRVDIEDHIRTRAEARRRSAKNELVFLKAVLKRASGRGQRVDERILAIEPIRHVAREGVALTPDQLNVLASVMPERLRRLVLLGGTIGARASELYTLAEDQLELDAKPEPLMRVWRSTLGNKSRKEKAIPLTPNEARLFREQLLARPNGTALVFPRPSGTAYTVNGFLKDVWPNARKHAAAVWREEQRLTDDAPTVFDGLHVHDLRHTAISLMCRAGYRPEWVAERVGHNDGGALILRNYRHLYPTEMSAVAPNLDALLEAAAG
jgi:integrase